jgi:hypothetical protein
MRGYGRRSRLFTLLIVIGVLLASYPGAVTQAADTRATAAAPARQATIQAAGAVRVDFTVDGITTSYGQDLYIIGSAAELGSWDVTRAVKLTWIDSDTWSGWVDFSASAGQTILYKYIIRQGSSTTWETIADRSYAVPSAGSTSVNNVWNQVSSPAPLPPLGAHIVSGGVKFTLFSQNATRVELSIFSSPTASTPSSTHLLSKDAGAQHRRGHLLRLPAVGAELAIHERLAAGHAQSQRYRLSRACGHVRQSLQSQ